MVNFNIDQSILGISDSFNKMNLTDNTGAILYLFTPKNIPKQVRRPHVYNFGYETLENIFDSVNKNISRGLNTHESSFMYNYPMENSIQPTPLGIDIHTGVFSELWTFMLVVDNDKRRDNINNGFHNTIVPNLMNNNNRIIYTGFCSDEPLSINGIPNPRCIFQFTHQTILNYEPRMSSNGMQQNPTVTKDIDILPSKTVVQLSPESEYRLDPESVRNCTYTDYYNSLGTNNSHTFMEANAYIPSEETNIQMTSALNSPRHHLQKVVKAVNDSLFNISNESNESGPDTRSVANPFMLGPDVYVGAFDDALKTPIIDARLLIGLNTKHPISFQELQNRYYGLKIIRCKIHKDSQWDIVDPSVVSADNVMSSLVASTLPTLMANIGIMEISFRYDSYIQKQINEEMGEFELFRISTFTQLPNDKMVRKWEVLKSQLKKCLFPIIFLSGNGHFSLQCYCSSAGENLILLNFMDDAYNTNKTGLYEVSNRLGGLNSPMIGSKENLVHNNNNLNLLTDAIIPFADQMTHLEHMPF